MFFSKKNRRRKNKYVVEKEYSNGVAYEALLEGLLFNDGSIDKSEITDIMKSAVVKESRLRRVIYNKDLISFPPHLKINNYPDEMELIVVVDGDKARNYRIMSEIKSLEIRDPSKGEGHHPLPTVFTGVWDGEKYFIGVNYLKGMCYTRGRMVFSVGCIVGCPGDIDRKGYSPKQILHYNHHLGCWIKKDYE